MATLGLDAKLYLNTGSYASPSWSEATKCRSVTVSLEKGTADVSVRGNNGWRATQGTLKDITIEFELVVSGADTIFTAIKNAFFNNTNVDMLALDGNVVTTGSQGPRAEYQVINFSRNEPLEDALTYSVSLKAGLGTAAPYWWTT
jgi:hypothetical protein